MTTTNQWSARKDAREKRASMISLSTKESESCDERRQLEETSATKSRKLSTMSRRYGLSVVSKLTSRESPSLRHLPQLRKSRHVYSWISTRQRVSAPCGRFLYALVRLRIFTNTIAHIYQYPSSYPQGLTWGFIYFPWSLIAINCRTISSRGKPTSQR